jgi:hypothetical protein
MSNPVTITVSLSARGKERFEDRLPEAFKRSDRPEDAPRLYKTADALMKAADEIACSPTGHVLQWNVPYGSRDHEAIRETLEHLSDDGYAWVRVETDDYGAEYDCYGRHGEYLVNDERLAFDLGIEHKATVIGID